MRVHRLAVPWERGRQVAVFVADQTYEWIGMQKRGRRSMVEQHDAFGMPVFIKHEVYINSVHVHLPASIGTLSARAWELGQSRSCSTPSLRNGVAVPARSWCHDRR